MYASILLTECLNVLQTQDQAETRLELAVYLTCLLGDLIFWGYDPRPSISEVFNVLYKDLEMARPYMNILLVALTPVLHTISPVYLSDLLRLLRLVIVTADSGNRITQRMILDGLIIWIALPLCIPEDSLGNLNKLMKHIKQKQFFEPTTTKSTLSVKYFHPNIPLCLNIAVLSESLSLDSTCSHFLSQLKSTQNQKFLERINTFIRGIFLLDYPTDTHDILLGIVRKGPSSIAIELIRPWLYKLSNEKVPARRLKLMKGLTSFAMVKVIKSCCFNGFWLTTENYRKTSP